MQMLSKLAVCGAAVASGAVFVEGVQLRMNTTPASSGGSSLASIMPLIQNALKEMQAAKGGPTTPANGGSANGGNGVGATDAHTEQTQHPQPPAVTTPKVGAQEHVDEGHGEEHGDRSGHGEHAHGAGQGQQGDKPVVPEPKD